jgi:hypothetical protein
VNTSMGRKMVKESMSLQTDTLMRGIGLKMKFVEKANLSLQTEILMRGIGLKMKFVGKAN